MSFSFTITDSPFHCHPACTCNGNCSSWQSKEYTKNKNSSKSGNKSTKKVTHADKAVLTEGWPMTTIQWVREEVHPDGSTTSTPVPLVQVETESVSTMMDTLANTPVITKQPGSWSFSRASTK